MVGASHDVRRLNRRYRDVYAALKPVLERTGS
jgi:hypothetical protein